MTAAVVDASVATKWFVDEEWRDDAIALLNSGVELRAPRLIVFEVANSLWKKVVQESIDEATALDALRLLDRYFTDLFDAAAVMGPALSRAVQLGHPVYDLVYLEGARQQNVPMITADKRFLAKLKGSADENIVIHLADWRP